MYFDVRAAKLLQPGGHLLVQGCAGLRLVVSASRKMGHIPKDVVGTYNAYSYDAERLHWLGKLDGLLASLAGDAPARP